MSTEFEQKESGKPRSETERQFKANVPLTYTRAEFKAFKLEAKSLSHNDIYERLHFTRQSDDLFHKDIAQATQTKDIWDLESIKFGLVLGDGLVPRKKAGLKNMIKIFHGYKQAGFVFWKHSICQHLGLVVSKTPARRFNFSETRRRLLAMLLIL